MAAAAKSFTRKVLFDEDGTPSFVVGTIHYTFPEGLQGPRDMHKIVGYQPTGQPVYGSITNTDVPYIVKVGDEGSSTYGRVQERQIQGSNEGVMLPPEVSGERGGESGACSATSTEVHPPRKLKKSKKSKSRKRPRADSVSPVRADMASGKVRGEGRLQPLELASDAASLIQKVPISPETGLSQDAPPKHGLELALASGSEAQRTPNSPGVGFHRDASSEHGLGFTRDGAEADAQKPPTSPLYVKELKQAKRKLRRLKEDRRARRSEQGGRLTEEQISLYREAIARKRESIRQLKLRARGSPQPSDSASADPNLLDMPVGSVASVESRVPVIEECAQITGDVQTTVDPVGSPPRSVGAGEPELGARDRDGLDSLASGDDYVPQTEDCAQGDAMTAVDPEGPSPPSVRNSESEARVTAGSNYSSEGYAQTANDPEQAGESSTSLHRELAGRRDIQPSSSKSKTSTKRAPPLTPLQPGSSIESGVEGAGYTNSEARVTAGGRGRKAPMVAPSRIQGTAIVDVEDEAPAVLPPLAKPSSTPYQSGLLRQMLNSQRLPAKANDGKGSDSEGDGGDFGVGDDDERDPNYVPNREDEGESSDDDGNRREAPDSSSGIASGTTGNLRGKVPRRPRNDGQSCEAVVTCPIPGCFFSGVNVRRHLRGQPHNFSELTLERVIQEQRGPAKPKQRYAKLACPLIGRAMTLADNRICTTSSSTRLDLHLPKHGLSRGTPEFDRVYAQAKLAANREGDAATGDFEHIFDQYRLRAEGRFTGKPAKPGTTRCDRSALKLFLPKVSAQSVADLTLLGNPGGRIDTLVNDGKYVPKTLSLYLTSVRKFLEWLSSSLPEPTAVRERLAIDAGHTETVCRTLNMFIKSLAVDHTKMEQLKLSEEGLRPTPKIQAWMEAEFQRSDVIKDAAMLAERARHSKLSGRERRRVRDALYTALMLDQIRRAGDVNQVSLRQAQIVLENWRKDGCPNDRTYQILVVGAKTTSSGMTTPINIPPQLFPLFRNYTEFVRPQFEHAARSPHLVVSDKSDKQLTPTGITKLYRKAWDAFREEYGRKFGPEKSIPELTASDNRSMNVTEITGHGASREELTLVAEHMSHSVRAQRRDYNKDASAALRRSRNVSDKARTIRRSSAKAQEKELRRQRRASLLAKSVHGLGASDSSSDPVSSQSSSEDGENAESVQWADEEAPIHVPKGPGKKTSSKVARPQRPLRDAHESGSDGSSSRSLASAPTARADDDGIQSTGGGKLARADDVRRSKSTSSRSHHEGSGYESEARLDSGRENVGSQLSHRGHAGSRSPRRPTPVVADREDDADDLLPGTDLDTRSLNEPLPFFMGKSKSGRAGSKSAPQSTLTTEGSGHTGEARLADDCRVGPIPAPLNEPVVHSTSRGQSTLVGTTDLEWLESLPHRSLQDLLHDLFDRSMNSFFQTSEAKRKLKVSQTLSLPWELVITKIRDSTHPWAVRMATFVHQRHLKATEKLRGKLKWLCKQFIDKHGLTVPSTYEAWVSKMEDLDYY